MRRVRGAALKLDVSRVHRDNFRVYGVEKIWLLNRPGFLGDSAVWIHAASEASRLR